MMLKGLSYAPSGAIAAAATTSLPRVPGGSRNYDSRYSFLRDSALALRALYSLGFDWEADDFFFFLADLVERGKPLRNLYPVAGEEKVEEEELDHFTGYEHARPVRIGNAAASYEQHDVWGAVLDAAYLYAGTRDRLPARLWPIVESQVEAAVANWRKPDMGIWASRREKQHYVSSKVMCWVACDRGSKLAARRDQDRHAERWREVANEIKEDVLADGVDTRGVFTAWYGTEELDASVLLIPIVGFLPPSDERVVATVEAIASELVEGGLVLRRRPPGTPRGVVPPGETYIVCSFWLAHALALIGETGRARALCEKMLALSSPLQLYAEHLDPDTGRHLGNYPAAMTHLALINALMEVIEAENPMA
jgi:GH15 family glucan-1,4-alpha-glucosidase